MHLEAFELGWYSLLLQWSHKVVLRFAAYLPGAQNIQDVDPSAVAYDPGLHFIALAAPPKQK